MGGGKRAEARLRKMGKREIIEGIALGRFYRLFGLAGAEFALHPERSNRYVELALKIGKRCNVSVPQELKRNYCKKCHSYLKEGKNAKIRVSGSILKITCGDCGATKKVSAVKRERRAGKRSQGKSRKG